MAISQNVPLFLRMNFMLSATIASAKAATNDKIKRAGS